MRMVRFIARAFFEGRIVEPGEELPVADDVLLGAHMVDLTPGAEQPRFTPRVVSVFRADLAHGPGTTVLSSDEIRAKATEEAMTRAEATRQAEVNAAVARTMDPNPAAG